MAEKALKIGEGGFEKRTLAFTAKKKGHSSKPARGKMLVDSVKFFTDTFSLTLINSLPSDPIRS